MTPHSTVPPTAVAWCARRALPHSMHYASVIRQARARRVSRTVLCTVLRTVPRRASLRWQDVLKALPNCTFSIDLKDDSRAAIKATLQTIQQSQAEARVIVGCVGARGAGLIKRLAPQLPSFFTATRRGTVDAHLPAWPDALVSSAASEPTNPAACLWREAGASRCHPLGATLAHPSDRLDGQRRQPDAQPVRTGRGRHHHRQPTAAT